MNELYIIIGAIALVIVFVVAFILGMLYRKRFPSVKSPVPKKRQEGL